MRKMYAALVVLAALAVATPASAQQEWHYKIFGGMAYVAPLGEENVDVGAIEESIQASEEIGYEFGVEFRFGKLVGLELSYVDAEHDIEQDDVFLGTADMKPLNLALNFHIVPTKHFDLYIAPVASYVTFGDFEPDGGGASSEVDSEIAYGAQLGIDIGFGKTFAIYGGLRWLSLDAETDSAVVPEVAVDPLFARLGVAFRF